VTAPETTPAAPVLRVVGKLSADMAGALRATVAALTGESAYVVDLSGVSCVEDAGVDALVRALRSVRRAGAMVSVVGWDAARLAPSPAARIAMGPEVGVDDVPRALQRA